MNDTVKVFRGDRLLAKALMLKDYIIKFEDGTQFSTNGTCVEDAIHKLVDLDRRKEIVSVMTWQNFSRISRLESAMLHYLHPV